MQPQACRDQFAHLLAEETTLLTALEQQLQREHQHLAGNDVDGLERAGGERQQTVARLLRLEDERRDLCRLLGQSPDQAGMAALLTWCDPSGSLAGAQAESTALATRCRSQNERNGALVTARLTRVTSMLELVGANAGSRTYGPQSARAASAAPAGRMVSVSA